MGPNVGEKTKASRRLPDIYVVLQVTGRLHHESDRAVEDNSAVSHKGEANLFPSRCVEVVDITDMSRR